MAIISILLTAIIIIVAILLVLVVLVQRPKQEGLGAAFGGGAFDSALGAHTTDVLQKITTYLAAVYFVSAIGLAMVKARQFSTSPASNVLEGVEATEATPPPGLPEGIPQLPSSVGPADPAKSVIDEVINTPLVDDTATETPAPTEKDPAAPAAKKEETPKAKQEAPQTKSTDPKEAVKKDGK